VHAANSFAEIPTVSQRNIVGKVEIKSAFDQRTEANEIATWISQLIGSGLAANEIAVLTRLNAQLPLIENALRGIGITASTNSASGGVDLMTIHSAKGLEW
jgi:superfamily I DNA/RNA helicase